MSRGWKQAQEIPRERKESKRTSEIPPATWLGGAQRGIFWLYYAGPLAEKRKNGISGKRHRPKLIPGERTVEKVRRGRRASDGAKKRVYRFRVRPK